MNAQMQSAPQKTKSTSATLGLVLACLFFLPPLPLIGLILGIVALVKQSKDPNLGGKGLAIAAIVVAILGTVPGAGICAAVAIPSFVKYTNRAKVTEAETNLATMSRLAQSYVETNGALPPSAPLTPPLPCSSQPEGRCAPGVAYPAEVWAQRSWAALGFSVVGPHYFQYEFVAAPGGGFVARAVGDLDGDGITSIHERRGQLNGSGGVILDPIMTSTRPME